MEIRLGYLICIVLLVSCTKHDVFLVRDAHSYSVEKFQIDEARGCRRSDINLNQARAQEFFSRARQVEYREIHDRYDIAPCSAYGSLSYKGNACRWNINAGGTGWIACSKDPERVDYYFACDNCDDLLTYQEQRGR